MNRNELPGSFLARASAMATSSSANVISGAPFEGGGGKHGLRIERDGDLVEGRVPRRPRACRQVRGVARAFEELQLDQALLAVEPDLALLRKIHRGLIASGRVREEHIPPAPAGRQAPDVDHPVGEVLEEHAGLDAALDARRHHAEGDFPEGLVALGQGDDGLVGGGGGRHDRDDRHGTDQAGQADAARLKRHELAIRRQPAEADEDAEQHRHRDGQAQRLGQERQEQPGHDRERNAARDERLAFAEDGRDLQDEGRAPRAQSRRASRSRASGSDRGCAAQCELWALDANARK